MTSPSSVFDRFASSQNRVPFLFPRRPQQRPPNEYDMEELEPRPLASMSDQETSTGPLRRTIAAAADRKPSVDSWNDWASSASSPSSSKGKSRAMFAGPPPPIAQSMVLSNRPKRPTSSRTQSSYTGSDRSPWRANDGQVREVIFDERSRIPPRNTDSVWRGLQRQERALESEIQQLLDLQAAGLVAGSSGAMHTNSTERDGYSDSGSSTPTGTFYSTATSKSRMVNSLYVPTRATPDGDVIPVRQPAKGRSTGLSAARAGLQGTIDALADLKREEDAYIDASLSQRKKALVQLGRLSIRKDGIANELSALEGDDGEPLGQELRDLGAKYDSITQEIRVLEEKLVGMRNQRRWLRDKMDDVRNKREAGLSGYRGALKDVDSELTTILRRPPVRPLDPEMYDKVDEVHEMSAMSSGAEFLQLLPERRTVDMAKSWWEGEITLLERQKEKISKERQALEDGSAMWRDTISLVSNFESNLRQLMKRVAVSEESEESPLPVKEILREHTASMNTVIEDLERYLKEAESKHWNLLICAIGAEMEAFKEAQNMLKKLFSTPDENLGPSINNQVDGKRDLDRQDENSGKESNDPVDESDNEVPPDLLVSHYDEHVPDTSGNSGAESDEREDDSGNEVPPEFLDGKDDADRS